MNPKEWRTADEILWLDSIGNVHAHTISAHRAGLLANYLETALVRKNWGKIDKAAAVRHAVKRHAELMAAREVSA